MIPEVRHDLDKALRAINDSGLRIHSEFPMAEFITAVGFFFVLLFEEVTNF